MLSVALENRKVFVRRDRIPPRPPGFARIRLLRGGICNTDLELLRGYYGFRGTPGHEFVGEVVEADDRRWVGRRVVAEINLACGDCEWCNRGFARHCPRRKVLGIVKHPGAFREYLTMPEQNLHEVPANVPTDHAVFVEPLAAACEILDQIWLPAGAAVAVLGDGKLGLLIAQALLANGANVHHFGRHKENLRISERAGAEIELARKNMPKAAYNWIVEATGSPEGLQQAILMTRPRGVVVLKSTMHGLTAMNTADVVVNEITMIGSRCGRFEPALDLLSSGRVQVNDLIDRSFPLHDARKAFERAAQPGVLKVLLRAD